VRPLVLKHLGHAELVVLGVAYLLPQGPAAVPQPGVEFDEGAEAFLRGIDPDAKPAVLHVLLDDTLLPASGDVAEVGIDQVVRAHHREALVDGAALAFVHLVYSALHVVVDAAPGDATQGRGRAGVRVEQHLVALTRVGHQPERPAGAQLQVRDLHAVVDAAHDQALFAPVELEGLAQLEGQGHEGRGGDGLAFTLAPGAHEVGDAAVAAAIAFGLDRVCSARAVRRSCRGRCASIFNACRNDAWKGVSLPGASMRRYLGSSSTAALSHLRTVLRDKLVSRTISRTEFFLRKNIRLTLPITAMVITPSPLLKKEAGKLNTRVKFESALSL